MRRFYFDFRNGDRPSPDNEGLELPSFHAVQEEAARSLAESARDAIRDGNIDRIGDCLAVEVRDQDGPVLQTRFSMNVIRR